ncbi:MAG TPA: R3H domain-containing nucleic acid-binding protein [Bdellovibrionales bacterium]|nr:R3H domain-containing nucleic acid-binding protein [Bdellovibrionales bacterium]
MTGLFGKLFGKKDGKKIASGGPDGVVSDILENILKLGGFELSFEIKSVEDENINVEVFGKDEELLTSKEGALLDSLQLYVRRAVQHQFPDQPLNVNIDCANFREQANEALIALAEKLRDIALTKGKWVYFRALPPKDRKVIHQHLAEDGRVKSRSVGEGHFKKIKIYPVKMNDTAHDDAGDQDEAFGNR